MRYIVFLFFVFLSLDLSAQCDTAMIYGDTVNNQVCFDTTYSKVRNCYANGIPDHDDSYNSSFDLEPWEVLFSMCIYPDTATNFTPLYEEVETTAGCTDIYTFGIGLNGIMYDPNSGEYFEDSTGADNIEWHVEARYLFSGKFGNNGGHLNPFGKYHYHDIPIDYFTDSLGITGSAHSSIVGWAADGFPIYYKYVYSDASDTSSAITALSSGYSLKSGTRPGDGYMAPDGAYTGLYYEDYEYTTTTLDSCNGRWGKTPDFPDGTYYYVLTDNYPYIPRCFKGTVLDHTFRVGPDASCPDSSGDTDCSDGPVEGCTDPFSCNYNPLAEVDDGSCDYNFFYDTMTVNSCGSYTSPSGTMYNSDGTYRDTVSNGSCDSIYYITLTVSGAESVRNLTNPSTSSSSDGQILFGPPTGTSPYQFSIDSGLNYSSSTPPKFTGLTEGSYWTVIKDGNNCEMFELVELSAPLPVELLEFKARLIDEQVQLNWSTASELNSDYFEVQRSYDGFQFVSIDEITAQHYSSVRQNYQFTDRSASGNKVYYRLRMVDQDASFEYSSIQVVDLGGLSSKEALQVYPNPAATELTIVNGTGELLLYNVLGQQVKRVEQSDQVFSLNISDLPPGKYFIRQLNEDQEIRVGSFLKVGK